MWQLLGGWFGRRLPQSTRTTTAQRRNARLSIESLEERAVLSSYTAGSVSDLIADINAANLAGGSNTIALAAKTTFSLTQPDNTVSGGNGANGLPIIAANDSLTIQGNGAVVERSSQATGPFRLFEVAANASLTLQSLTLQRGLASGQGTAAEGGAVYNQGALDLNGVTVQNNIAQGTDGIYGASPAAGGAIYSGGTLTIEGNAQIKNNQALGAIGANGFVGGRVVVPAQMGGSGLGGGLFVAGGTATVIGVTLSGNLAQGGAGGDGAIQQTFGYYGGSGGHGGGGGSGYVTSGATGGSGLGGGLYIAGGNLTVQNATVTANTANGGAGGQGSHNGSAGVGEGGGLYIDALALAYLDAFTQANFKHDHASTSGNSVYGSYSTAP
jgi:hypothetical protein